MSGGTVIHTHVETGDIYVSSGGVDSQSTVTDEGYEYIWGGQSYDTKVDASSVQVLDEGIVSGATIAGLQFVYGGDAEATIVLSNGTQLLSSGRADGTIVYGTQDVSELNIAYATIANATSIEGGLMDVGSGATIIDPSLTAISGGALELGSGDIVISGAINFAVGSATLQIDTKDMPTAVISGFAPTDIISLHAVKYNSSDTTSVSGNEVSVMTPSGTYVLDIAGASNDAFQVTSGHGGTFLEIATEASTSNQSLVQLHNPAAADTQSSLTFAPNVSNSEGWGWSTMAAIDGRAPIQPGVLLSAEVGGAMAMWLDAESPSSNLVVSTDRG